MKTVLSGTMIAVTFAVATLWSPASLAESYNETTTPDHHTVGLVRIVREATAKYRDVAAAEADGYVQATGCVSSPSQGAMGVHYARLDLFGDGVSDPAQPELLVYEPTRYGSMRLVAVEYIIFADIWDAASPGVPPQWAGQSANFIGMPNRYALPAVYELHVWAWRDNPAGMFANFNPRVSCEDYNPAS